MELQQQQKNDLDSKWIQSMFNEYLSLKRKIYVCMSILNIKNT